jgi:large subunit ribosomal protein L9
MRLILLEDVEGLGRKGDVVDVADGYARNYLMPKRLGAKATAGALKDAERLRLAREEADRKAREEAEALSAAREGFLVPSVRVTSPRPSGDSPEWRSSTAMLICALRSRSSAPMRSVFARWRVSNAI